MLILFDGEGTMIRRFVLLFTVLAFTACASMQKPAPPPDPLSRALEFSCAGLSTAALSSDPTGTRSAAGAAVCGAWIFYLFIGQPLIDACLP
jgi:hypothetical protein